MNETIQKKRNLMGVLLLAALIAAPIGIANFGTAHAADDDEEELPLEEVMATVSSRHKRMRRSITDASKRETNITYVVEMQAAAAQAKLYKPAMIKSVPESQQAKFLAAYSKSMNLLIRELLVLEEALIDGKMDAAKASYDKLSGMKKTAHDKFIEE
jgi:soluble cytochrome b562